MSSPTPQPGARRVSFLDAGGPNSINNFASLFLRAALYAGSALLEPAVSPSADLSPCTLSADPEQAVDAPVRPRGHDNIQTFAFGAEERPLLAESGPHPEIAGRAASVASLAAAGAGSTAAQTVFNSVNTLMGIALLTLSFGFRLTGWIVGVGMLVVTAAVSAHTAKILGRVLARNPQLATYGDIARLYGGRGFQAAATATFTVDLLGALLSLVILFADSFVALFPRRGADVFFKALIVVVTFFMSFAPLRVVSIVSLTGILGTLGIIALIVVCGVVAPAAPGSLRQPAPTSWWPESPQAVVLSVGIFMALWGGHPVFPELYNDMRHPAKYASCCSVTFAVAVACDLVIAAVGYLMFGAHCRDSLTKNISAVSTYPAWVQPAFCVFMALLPISKLALVTRPLVSVYEKFFDMDSAVVYKNGKRIHPMSAARIVARFFLLLLLLVLSLVFTSFGAVVAFLGSAICLTICVTLPLMFHLKFNADEILPVEKFFTRCGVAVGIVAAVLGTYGSLVFNTGT